MSAFKRQKVKDVFNVEVNIQGVDEADGEDKYVFVEDKHAIGDVELLENEAVKGENRSNVTTFVVLFIVISVSSAICCYLNYTFAAILS